MKLIDKVRTRIKERVKREFHSLSPIYQRYLKNKWEAEGEPVPSLTPATPPVDLRPSPVPPGRRASPVCDTPRPTMRATSTPTSPTYQTDSKQQTSSPGLRKFILSEPERKSEPIPTDWGTEDEALRQFWDMVSRVSRIRR